MSKKTTIQTIDQNHYLKFLNDVKDRVRNSRIQVAREANKELIQLY